MNEGSLITIVIVILGMGAGFIGNAIYLKGVFGTKIAEHDRRLNYIEEVVVRKDNCLPRHDEINRRFERFEHIQNGGG